MSAPPQEPEETQQQEVKSVAAELLDKSRLMLILGILALELVLFFAGLLVPIPPATREALANATNSQFAPMQGAGPVQLAGLIFSHNLLIALAEMIPAAGAFLFVISIYSTGLAAQALITSQGLPAQWGAVLFAYPYSLVELTGYAVAVAAGTRLILAGFRKRLKREARVFAAEAGVVAGILLAAAAMEATTKASPLLGFALWLPMGLVVAGVIVAFRVKGT